MHCISLNVQLQLSFCDSRLECCIVLDREEQTFQQWFSCLFFDHDVWSTRWFSPDDICLNFDIHCCPCLPETRALYSDVNFCSRMWLLESAIQQFIWYFDILVSLDSWCRSMFGLMFWHSWVPGLVMLFRVHVGVSHVLWDTSILR